MNIHIEPRKLKGSVHVISSKSLSHRYVIASGLAHGVSTIKNVLISDDLEYTKKALSSFGVQFQEDSIRGSMLNYDGTTLDCGESGSTLRFMIPIAMMQDKEVKFTGKGKLPERPLNVYQELFKDRDVLFKHTSDQELPLIVKGPLLGGDYHLRGDVSSQFITGLLFALPLAKKDSKIILTTPLTSKDYVELTLDVLKEFGVDVKRDAHGFEIKGNQTYQPATTEVEGDFSQAAFFLVAGLIGEEITLFGLNPSSKQGDKKIVDLLKKMGGNIIFDDKKKAYIASPSVTKGITIDLTDIPDLGPILMVLASLSEGITHFKGVSRLRIKESDRLAAMDQALSILGVSMKIQDDEAWIEGVKNFKGNVNLNGAKDHRIVMALSIASLKANGAITISTAESISKSYPTFFEIFNHLGGYARESE